MHARVVLALIALMSVPGIATAQAWPALNQGAAVERSGALDAAVIVAVEDYAFLPDVPRAVQNAADWERFLTKDLGVPTVLMLTNAQAVREDIVGFASRAAEAVQPGGTLWFVFIGHGAPTQDGTDGLLIGADGQQNLTSLQARGVRQQELLNTLGGGQQARTVVLFDACFSGQDRAGDALAKGTMPVVATSGPGTLRPNMVVMTAARADEVAGDLPGAARPAFSYLALGALRGWGDDGNGQVTAEEIVAYSRQTLLGVPGRRQTPQLYGAGNLVLTSGGSEEAPAASLRAASATSSGTPVDGIPDFPLYMSVQMSLGSRTGFGDVGLGSILTAGYKLNYGTLNPREWRVGGRFHAFGSRPAGTPEVGDYATSPLTGNGTVIDDNDTIRSTRTTTLFGAAELSFARRREYERSVDTVLAAGVFGGGGAQPKRCTDWEKDVFESEVNCTTKTSHPIFGGGAFGQAQWGPLRVEVHAGYLHDIGLLAGGSIGLVIDP